MLNRWFSLTSVAFVLTTGGIALSNRPSLAEASAGATAEASCPLPALASLQVQPTGVDCRQVACASDFDCEISQACSNNTCSHPAPGQAFGSCTVQPQ